MASERELIPVITRLSRQSQSIEEAIGLFQAVLTEEIGGCALRVEPTEEGTSFWAAESIAALMDSRIFPFRGLYTASLTVGNKKAGRLVACFGSFGAPGKALSHLTAHIAQQLGEIPGRTRRTPFQQAVPLSASPIQVAPTEAAR